MDGKGLGTPITPELIPVRPGEELDQGELSLFLRDRLEGAGTPLRVQQFGGGHANLTYLLRFGDREYVLRRPPLGTKAAKSHDIGREYKVLSVLYKVFPLAPRAFLYCDDPSVCADEDPCTVDYCWTIDDGPEQCEHIRIPPC